MQSEIKFLLLDLDGTLIHFNLDEFIYRYLSLIRKFFSNYSWANQVGSWILAGTDLMLKNQGPDSNQAVFLKYFSEKSGLSRDEIWENFLRFYELDFDRLQTITEQDKSAIGFLEKALTKDVQLVLATQPVFPEIAIRKRLAWAGLSHVPFCLITDIEKMSAAKPSARYFEEVLDFINARASDCLMIGNDPVADMSAAKTGINTFYIDGGKIVNSEFIADHSGDFVKLSRILGW